MVVRDNEWVVVKDNHRWWGGRRRILRIPFMNVHSSKSRGGRDDRRWDCPKAMTAKQGGNNNNGRAYLQQIKEHVFSDANNNKIQNTAFITAFIDANNNRHACTFICSKNMYSSTLTTTADAHVPSAARRTCIHRRWRGARDQQGRRAGLPNESSVFVSIQNFSIMVPLAKRQTCFSILVSLYFLPLTTLVLPKQ